MVERLIAFVTGASRGIGAETAIALAESGYDIALTYRNKTARAQEVATAIVRSGQHALLLACDITRQDAVAAAYAELVQWGDHLDMLVLNASGGMERELVAEQPDYAMRINRDAQVALVRKVLPLLRRGAAIVFVTSHWAHLYGKMPQIPAYEPVAESKYAGEQALRALQPELSALGIRLIVVTGDLIEGTITPKLLERGAPGLIEQRRDRQGALPTAREMGRIIAESGRNTLLKSGTTIVVGAPLDSMLHQEQ